MKIYNENKTEILDYNSLDFSKGSLKQDFIEKLIPAVEGVEEQGHYETIAEYPNGGKDVEWIVDVEGVVAVPEHIEKEEIQIYVPYTEKQLAQIEIGNLKQKLSKTDYQAIKFAEGMLTEEKYAPIRVQRESWREEIRKLESIIEEPIKVYVKTNTNNEIVQVESSVFMQDTTGWIKIDEGFGDKYAHAQSQYFDKQLINDEGGYNYKLINGKVYAKN